MVGLADILGIGTLEGKRIVDVPCTDGRDRPYTIVIQNAAQRLIVVPAYADSAAGRWRHERAMTQPKALEFKHSTPDGGKYWTRDEGVEHAFVIPDEVIQIIPEVTYSYPRLEIHGVTITASTSGGTSRDGKGWSDFIGAAFGTLVVRELEWLEALASVALPLPEGACQP
ncbi:MAG: hypothetical protein HC933_10115 [Pleurocapsa sp. SU_196_0]|nr:hypothetical protein [Pleurocapsa sp. SU_196_0]